MANNVHKLPIAMRIQLMDCPTVDDAYIASMELIGYQSIYPMLKTIEERENNVRKSQEQLEIMNRYIVGQYLKIEQAETIH